MVSFGSALRKAREDKGWSRKRLWLKIRARFENPISVDTIKRLELFPDQVPHGYVRRQLAAILEALR
jgi:ribosome-binding protein aMBF1 (putative translation factor)